MIHNISGIVFFIISLCFFLIGDKSEPVHSNYFGTVNPNKDLAWLISFISLIIGAFIWLLGYLE